VYPLISEQSYFAALVERRKRLNSPQQSSDSLIHIYNTLYHMILNSLFLWEAEKFLLV